MFGKGGKDIEYKRSLAYLHPELAAQWHEKKNGKLLPEAVLAGSHEKIWWRCPINQSHIWQCAVKTRVKGNNCPLCREEAGLFCRSMARPQINLDQNQSAQGIATNNHSVS